MKARLSGHRLTIEGVGVFFGKPGENIWRFERHGRVEDPYQVGVITLQKGEIKVFAHGDTEEKHPIPLDHLRNIGQVLTKNGRIKQHLVQRPLKAIIKERTNVNRTVRLLRATRRITA